jgi:putative cell wall-binding protein
VKTRRSAIGIAIVAAVIGLGPATARADTRSFEDPSGDVIGSDTGTATSEPRADITGVTVVHETRMLEVRIAVAQVVPEGDPVWDNQIGVGVGLWRPDNDDPTYPDFLWYLDGSVGTGHLLSFDSDAFGFQDCETDGAVDATAKEYVLRADETCLRDVPRTIAVQANVSVDPHPEDDSFVDYPTDSAPDDGPSAMVRSSGTADVTRVAGTDRVATAIALSEDQFDDGQAAVAVVTSSTSSADAIAGGPLAAFDGGPLLLTGHDGLDPRVATELERALEPGSDVFLLGGTAALGDRVVADLRELGFRPRRIAGTNRFETAVAVADELGDHSLVMIADGRGFREALIAGAAAASLGGVVVLTDGATLPPSTDDFLANDPSRHIAIGLAAEGARGAERIVAPSAPELSQKVLDRLLPSVASVAIASDATFADALAGAPHIAALGGGLLLTDPTELSTAVSSELAERKDDVREVILYGGTGALGSKVEQAVHTALS